MAALQNIKHIFLRGTTWLDFTQVVYAAIRLCLYWPFVKYIFCCSIYSITNVTMDTGIYLAGSKNNLALGVETCKCSKAYSGPSCQDPANGFYRWTAITITETEEYSYEQYVGKSLPCHCNGRSLSCHRETGHCEVCKMEPKIILFELIDIKLFIEIRRVKKIPADQIANNVPKVSMAIHSMQMDVNRARAQRQARILLKDAHSKIIVSVAFASPAIRAIFVNNAASAISVYPIMMADIVRNVIVIQMVLFPMNATN